MIETISMDLGRIITRCQAGDREAFGLLYQTYLPPMRKIVERYVHDPETVWDILHDGFLVALFSIGHLKNASKVEAWLTSIMKNLALQYLKEEYGHRSVSLSDVTVPDETDKDSHRAPELTWEELDTMIDRLPEGYGRVFRLAILDGMTHKEIGELLGIAPHSSSSQLARAKAMMRNMIIKYRIEMGMLSIVAAILFVWHGLSRHREDTLPDPAISRNTGKTPPAATGIPTGNGTKTDTTIQGERERTPYPQIQKILAGRTEPKDSVPMAENDSMANDTTGTMFEITRRNGFIAQDDLPHASHTRASGWTFSLAYSGNSAQRYSISNPDTEGPTSEIKITERVHHHMPLVIGMSISKPLTVRWSAETGLRYTFLRSDIFSKNKLTCKETIQRIHYIGIPLKLSYRILAYNGISLYGQGGCALDIPVKGRQDIWEYSPETGGTKTDILHVHAPLQWSVEGGLGVQYRLTPSFSIYAEPSFRYYCNPQSSIRTIRQERPFEFTIPIGLRLTW